MAEELRNTGIAMLGDLAWGTHFCLFYETKEDLLDLLIPYFKAGLENHEFCLCVASEPVIAEDAERILREAVPSFDRYMAEGQIEIVSHLHWYLTGGRFDPLRVRQGWLVKLQQSLTRGYAGMRFAANIFWLEKQDWESFAAYEGKLDEAFGKLRIIALCAYSLARCSAADMLDVIRHHQFSLVRRRGAWERLEGPELQHAHAEIRKLNADLERRVKERTAQLATAIEQLTKEIAERKRAEEELRRSREQLRALAAYLESVREEERTRIARELHDEIGQALTGIKLSLESAAPEQPENHKSTVAEALALVNELIARVRDVSLDLRPAMLDDLGLLAALTWHFNRYGAQAKIKVGFKHMGLEGRRFEPEIETAAYRIVQEALTNVARHAGTDRVEVDIRADQNRLRIRIEDKGVGFDPESLSTSISSGIFGMHERALALDGQLNVESAPGAGTILIVDLPLRTRR